MNIMYPFLPFRKGGIGYFRALIIQLKTSKNMKLNYFLYIHRSINLFINYYCNSILQLIILPIEMDDLKDYKSLKVICHTRISLINIYYQSAHILYLLSYCSQHLPHHPTLLNLELYCMALILANHWSRPWPWFFTSIFIKTHLPNSHDRSFNYSPATWNMQTMCCLGFPYF